MFGILVFPSACLLSCKQVVIAQKFNYYSHIGAGPAEVEDLIRPIEEVLEEEG